MTPDELGVELAKGRLRPAYLVAGDQALLRDEAVVAVRGAVLGDSPADFNLDRLEGASATPATLRDAVRMLPVMGARRLVWLREPESARGGSKALLEALADLVPALPDSMTLLVTAAKIDKRSRWVRAFAVPAALVVCDPPQGAAAIERFVRAEATKQQLTLEAGVAELLAERVGADLLALRHELEKAALLASPATRIRRADVEAGVVGLAEEPVWDLTDAIGEGRARDALPMLARLLAGGAAPPMLLGTLASHFRRLLRVRSGGNVAGPPFVVRKLERQAQRYTPQRLLTALRAIHDADLALKGQGGVPAEIALERLVLGLAA